MHRTTLVPRSLWWSLLLGCALHIGTTSAHAQGLEPLPPAFGLAQQPPVKDGELPLLILPVGETRQVEMSQKQIIKSVVSENPKFCRVTVSADAPRSVVVTGIAPGSTRIILTDEKKNTETLDVKVVPDDAVQRARLRADLLELIRRAVPTAAVDAIASPNGTVILTGNVATVDSVQVIVEAARSIFGSNANVVNAMRVGGVQQVQIEVVVARVNRTEARKIGFSFLNTDQKHFLASTIGGTGAMAANTVPDFLSPSASLTSSPNLVFGIFSTPHNFVGYLQALRTEGLAKIYAEPRVTTLSGRPAYIVSGGETPILTSSGTGAPNVTYKTFGTVVNFLPIVLGNGKIHLEVRPEISNLNAANSITITTSAGITSVPGFDIRSAQVAVQIEDGQTLAIGGLIQNTINATASKVPIVGDLPIVGVLFSAKEYVENEEELIILVTPRLVDGLACTQLPKYLPGRETRSPDDFELFLENIMEAPRGQRNVTCHPYVAAHKTGPTAPVYPCGDQSMSLHDIQVGHGYGQAGCSSCNGTGCTGPGCNGAAPKTNGAVKTPAMNNQSSMQYTAPMAMPASGTAPVMVDVDSTLDSVGTVVPATQVFEPMPGQGSTSDGRPLPSIPSASFGPAVGVEPR